MAAPKGNAINLSETAGDPQRRRPPRILKGDETPA
jgi:hypothetical protein